MNHKPDADRVASGSAGAPEHEIEVTPEMIAAGLSVLYDYDPSYSNEREIVAKIYEVMERMRAARNPQNIA